MRFPHQILALFAWEEWDEIEFGRGPCDLPLVLRFDKDLLSAPASTPKLSHLQTGIWVNPDTKEEIEYPAIWLRLNAEGTDEFKTFMQRIEHLFGSLGPLALEWQFLEIGLAYYMKALQSTGLEQLLWHITALEALLGEKGEGITERLARRISLILKPTKAEREKIRKQFKELYEFRSNLVHGNKFGKKVLVTHLTTARILARQTLL